MAHWVPARRRGKAVGVAAGVTSGVDVGKGRRSDAVQEGVQESEGRLADRSEAVIDKCDDTSKNRAGGNGAINPTKPPFKDSLNILAVGGNVGEATACRGEFSRVGAPEPEKVGSNRGRLIDRPLKYV